MRRKISIGFVGDMVNNIVNTYNIKQIAIAISSRDFDGVDTVTIQMQ